MSSTKRTRQDDYSKGRSLKGPGASTPQKVDDDEDIVDDLAHRFAKQNLHEIPRPVLEQVTREDRETSLYDLHGILDPVTESYELIQGKQQELMHALGFPCTKGTTASPSRGNVLPQTVNDTNEQSAFYTAIQTNPDFVKELLPTFLRAEGWDVEMAAKRVKNHFEKRLEFFGQDSLTRHLGWDDLDMVSRMFLTDTGLLWRRQQPSDASLLSNEYIRDSSG
eukprot:CAMPEP_0176021256 /NCGR_PEP_ID=MMETSP0120_2-20121206/10317_1 /TAXON_ID=160619 /ORGANISM="Kryptoperidinium foliaceum, Strain CCMP 1326" /LENGTH=221 /DNA_ID=CAMNT_0017354367 /DNA_START=118 /DNA_END=780 /DNA_ORIENTATION=+